MTCSGVEADNDVGRRIHDRKQLRQAQRRQGRSRLKRLFFPPAGRHTLSVDLLSIADMSRLTQIAETQAAARNPSRSFYGWATITVADAEHAGRQVIASPDDDDENEGGDVERNPYHGDIVLPVAVVADEGERDRHARELADAVEWLAPVAEACGDSGSGSGRALQESN